VGKWTLGRSRVRWASNIEIDNEKKESEVRMNLICSGQRLMMWAYLQGYDGLCSVQYGVYLD
jgi:hypothetical protein